MGLFCAHLKDDLADDFRYFITFVNREAADEWWRMISTPPSPYAANVRRISPQLYTQNMASSNNVVDFFSHAKLPDAKQFHRKVLITTVFRGNGTNAIDLSPVTFTDHISGKWYFIRPKADPWSHWYLRIDGPCLVCGDICCGAIHVSSEYRTKFRILVRNPADDFETPEDLVMIGRDRISIVAPENHTVHFNDVGDLKATSGYQGETDLIFSDLKDRLITRAEKQVNGEIWEFVVPVERGQGEVWELVD